MAPMVSRVVASSGAPRRHHQVGPRRATASRARTPPPPPPPGPWPGFPPARGPWRRGGRPPPPGPPRTRALQSPRRPHRPRGPPRTPVRRAARGPWADGNESSMPRGVTERDEDCGAPAVSDSHEAATTAPPAVPAPAASGVGPLRSAVPHRTTGRPRTRTAAGPDGRRAGLGRPARPSAPRPSAPRSPSTPWPCWPSGPRVTGLSRGGDVSCGGGTRLLPSADGWVAVSLTREDDWDLVAAWLGADRTGGPGGDWATAGRACRRFGVRRAAGRSRAPGPARGRARRATPPADGSRPRTRPDGIHGIGTRHIGSAPVTRSLDGTGGGRTSPHCGPVRWPVDCCSGPGPGW